MFKSGQVSVYHALFWEVRGLTAIPATDCRSGSILACCIFQFTPHGSAWARPTLSGG